MHGDSAPIRWLHRDARYQEKPFATPDVTIADPIGDIDPIKAATLRPDYPTSARHPLFGILPRTNRGIFAINELPDLQPRIQVGLLQHLRGEKDFQIRGFPMCAFRSTRRRRVLREPEDHTNRGIITPLRDRINLQITHYLLTREQGMAIPSAGGGRTVTPGVEGRAADVHARTDRGSRDPARKSEYADQNSGVSARRRSRCSRTVNNADAARARTGEKTVDARVRPAERVSA